MNDDSVRQRVALAGLWPVLLVRVAGRRVGAESVAPLDATARRRTSAPTRSPATASGSRRSHAALASIRPSGADLRSRDSTTSCRRSRRWARRSPWPISTATAGRTSMSTNSARGQPESPLPQSGRRHVQRRGRRAGRRGREPSRHRRVDGRRLGRLRQRRLRGSVPLQVRPSGAVSQRAGTRVHTGRRARRPSAVGQRQQRRLARLRPRRPARSVPRRLLAGGRRPLAPEDHADHAGELRVRRERRPEVPASQSRRRHVRGRDRQRSASTRVAGRSPSAPPTCSAPAIPDLFLANDYGVSQLFANRDGQAVRRGRPRDRRRPHAEERHERVVRRRLQRRPAVDLQDEHLRARRAGAGQRSLGAEADRQPLARARVRRSRRRAWASISAAGAGARSSAI